jgi:hypothetical protein
MSSQMVQTRSCCNNRLWWAYAAESAPASSNSEDRVAARGLSLMFQPWPIIHTAHLSPGLY